MICDLGGGKGKITRHYFFEGLKKLLIADSVNQFRERHDVSDELYAEMRVCWHLGLVFRSFQR